jgi:hypothetical protein
MLKNQIRQAGKWDLAKAVILHPVWLTKYMEEEKSHFD